MGCVAGVKSVENVGKSPSGGGKAEAQHDQDFHAKYMLDERIGKGSYALVHAVSEKTQAGGLHVGAKVRVHIVGSECARYDGLKGEIVRQKFQYNVWHVKLDVAAREETWWTKGENLVLEQEASSWASKAVKIIDLRDNENGNGLELCSRRIQSCKNEVSVWKRVMFHTNLVTLHEVFFDKCLFYFVMERCNSSLFKYMRGLPVCNERSIGGLLVQMIHAIKHLHCYRVVHRDVKPDNFLLGGPEGSTVKLCDYGLSAVLPEAGQLAGVHGTAPYMCPEMIMLRLSDEKADVWSVGVVAYLLLCGTFPYQPSYEEWSGQKMQEVIRDGGRPKCERSWLSGSAASMLKKLLTRKSLLRPTAKEALHLPLIGDATLGSKVSEGKLPCLRPVLEAAVSMGTSQRNLDSGLDKYLNFKQVQSHGRKMPPTDSNDMLEMPSREGDWVLAQNTALSRAMACNAAEAYGRGMQSSFSDDEKPPLSAPKTSESDVGACGSTCSTAAEQNREVTVFTEDMFAMKIED